MAVRGWGGAVAAAVGVAVAVGAAQLGLGYGLNVIRFAPGTSGQLLGGPLPAETWTANLTWAAWITATSTAIGAVVADRLGPTRHRPVAGRTDRVATVLWWLVLATAAALGATAAVGLVAVSARTSAPAGIASPLATAAGYAALGLVAGAVVAVGALAARAVAANLHATVAWVWLLAAVSVTDGVVAGRDWSRIPLGFWESPAAGPWFRNVLLPDAGLALTAALVVGALAALPAARRGDHPAGVVMSGAAGPLVLATAYLLTQPDLVGADVVDLSRQLTAPYLVLAGLVGSLLTGLVRLRPAALAASPPPGGAAPPVPGPVPAPGTGAAPAAGGLPGARGPADDPAPVRSAG